MEKVIGLIIDVQVHGSERVLMARVQIGVPPRKMREPLTGEIGEMIKKAVTEVLENLEVERQKEPGDEGYLAEEWEEDNDGTGVDEPTDADASNFKWN
jgi:hypothetical protein